MKPMDFFQGESKRLKALADDEPTQERLADVRAALASKFQGIQHLGAAVLAAWIRRARATPSRARRVALGRKALPGPESEWIDLLRQWTLTLPPKWWQSFSYSSRLFASFVGPEDVDWALELYFLMGSPFQRVVAVLPPEPCVARLKERAVSSPRPGERQDARFALRFCDFEGKAQLLASLEGQEPDPREVELKDSVEHDWRKGHGRRKRWK